MGFMDSYKHLEKLCGDMFDDRRGVSAYIDAMLDNPRGPYLVAGWNEDLKRLKHYRWIRNQIVHEPNCSEENMCDEPDAEWLDAFYGRIMDRTDPLALYRKSTQSNREADSPARTLKKNISVETHYTHSEKRHPPHKPNGDIVIWIAPVIFVLVVIFVLLLKN